jgi:hypothetical protein
MLRRNLVCEKRGMLLASETLKMILAVISLALLIYLLSALYFSRIEGQDKKEASSVFERISDAVLEIQGNVEKNSESITNIGPKGWKIISYVDDELKPNQCSGLRCLCICDDVFVEYFDRQVKECGKDGICEIMEDLIEFEDIEIESPVDMSIEVYQVDDRIGVRRV